MGGGQGRHGWVDMFSNGFTCCVQVDEKPADNNDWPGPSSFFGVGVESLFGVVFDLGLGEEDDSDPRVEADEVLEFLAPLLLLLNDFIHALCPSEEPGVPFCFIQAVHKVSPTLADAIIGASSKRCQSRCQSRQIERPYGSKIVRGCALRRTKARLTGD